MYLETKQKGIGLLLSDKDWKGMDFFKITAGVASCSTNCLFHHKQRILLVEFFWTYTEAGPLWIEPVLEMIHAVLI